MMIIVGLKIKNWNEHGTFDFKMHILFKIPDETRENHMT